MGNSNEKNEQDQKKEKEKKNEEQPQNETLRIVSSNYPIEENHPMILADNLYFNKQTNLGKKRNREENSNNQNKIIEDEKIIKKQKKEENKENDLNKNKEVKNKLEFKREQNINLEIVEHKEIKKFEAQSNFRESYTNNLPLPLKNRFDNKKNIIDNSIEFGINKINNNKGEIQEKINKEKYEKISLNSFMISSEEKNKNAYDEIKQNLKEKDVKDNSINEEDKFSYECLEENLYVKGFEGIDKLFIDIKIKNNGKLDWPKDKVFLKNNKELSQILSDDIKLIPVRSGLVTEERIYFKYLNKVMPGIYNSYINLNINGKNYGEPIIIKVEIVENEEEKKINNLIIKMRQEYQIPEIEINNDELKNVLIKNNYDTIKAFESLFGGN